MRAAKEQVEGERKPVTILFADIVGSTTMAESMDPEDWSEILTGAHQRVAEAIYQYEGTIAQLLGDGVLAFFGAPVAHEDDPIRAALAALKLQDNIHEYAQLISAGSNDFQMRVGIHSGTVVIGNIGTDLHMEYLAIGDAVNLAARLQSAADPGTILISDETFKRIGSSFDVADIGSIVVKGKSKPVSAYRLRSSLSGAREDRGLPGVRSPLIGRAVEKSKLREMVEKVRSGVGGLVGIVGDAGIGKSRLIRDLKDAIGSEGSAWVEGGCFSYGNATPYHLWVNVFQDLIGMETASNPTEGRDRLRQFLTETCPLQVEKIYPFLTTLLSLPLEGEGEAMIRDLEGEALKTGIFRAVETVFECIAENQPLVLICEDIHWADATSLELVQQLLALPSRAPILLICALRPEKDHRSWELWENMTVSSPAHLLQLSLEPLPDFECEAIIQSLLSGSEGLEELKERILDQAEGNPFYIEELIRVLMDTQVLVVGGYGEGWRLTKEIREFPIPDTLQGILLTRMDRLFDEARRMLQVASVIGRRFEPGLVDDLTLFPTSIREACLNTLEDKEFIHYSEKEGKKEWVFKHALTQEVAYETLLKRSRRELHGRVGESLEALHRESLEEEVERLADHFYLGEVWDKAWIYNTRAGKKAKKRFANHEAITFFENCCEITDHLPQIQPHDHAGVYLLIGEVLTRINQYEDALVALDQGLGVFPSDDLSHEDKLIRARIYHRQGQVLRSKGDYETAIDSIQKGIEELDDQDLRERGALKIALASALTRRGDYEAAQSHCEAGIQDVEVGGDKAELAHGYSLLGTIRRDQGDTSDSLSFRQKSLEISEEIANIPLQMEAHNNLAVAYYDLGQLDQAIHHYENSQSLSEQIGNRNTAARAEINLGEVYQMQGEFDLAEVAFRRAIMICERTGWALGQAYGGMNLGGVLRRKGQLEEALSYLKRSEDTLTELGARGFLTIVYRRQSSVNLLLGDLEQAESLAQKSLELAREISMRQEEGAALLQIGILYRQMKDIESARDALLQSSEIYREAGIQYEEGRALVELAQLWSETGEVGQADSALDRAIEVFEKLGAKVDLKRALELHGQLAQ
jgi:class 3 adenylate cyclase/tetratricopeptide (TPR) repeat protein